VTSSGYSILTLFFTSEVAGEAQSLGGNLLFPGSIQRLQAGTIQYFTYYSTILYKHIYLESNVLVVIHRKEPHKEKQKQVMMSVGATNWWKASIFERFSTWLVNMIASVSRVD
jgi:hypothetical protein